MVKTHSVQMVFIDVLKNIHGADEHNAMRPVMAAFDELRRISGSQVCVLHHTNHGAQPGKARASGETAYLRGGIGWFQSSPTPRTR